jgi:hypothetical protein
MLAVVLRRMVREAENCVVTCGGTDPWLEDVKRMARDTSYFCRTAARLLLEEKVATQSGQLTKLGSVNSTVDSLRRELFGEKMSHSGVCGDLFNRLDRMLLNLLRLNRAAGHAESPDWRQARP